MKHSSRQPRGMRLHPAKGILPLVMATLVAAACTSPSSNHSVASLPGHGGATLATGLLTAAQSDRDMVDFARCLRSHGVAEPDPAHRPGHLGLSIEIPAPGPETTAALAECNHFIAPIAQMKEAHARQELATWLPALSHYAECMRSHDIGMLDPNDQGVLNLGNVPGISSDFGRYSAQFRTADTACRHLLPAGVHDDGTGP